MSPAQAASTTDTFQVSITIVDSCAVSATDLAFGGHADLTSQIDATSTITVTCSNGTAYLIGLSGGLNSLLGIRYMTDGSNDVQYGLYQDALHLLPWGASVGVDTISGTGNGAGQARTVYGRVPVQANPGPGTYTDTVTVTVTF